MNTSSLGAPAFDVFNQTFYLIDSYGVAFGTTLDQLAVYANNAIITCIIYGSQIGAAAIILVLMLILTKAEKRRLPVFMLNSAALAFNILANILECLYWTGPWYSPYAYLSGDYSFVTSSAKAISISEAIFLLLTQLCLEASLVLQVHIVCVTLDRAKRLAILVVSILVALLAMAFRLVQAVENIKYGVIEEAYTTSAAWISKARDITLTISICFFSAIFCLKLGWSLRQRRQLGMKQFGPMQIILIGGTQTLIIPAIFAVLQFAKPTTRAGSLILTITAISLPLTSLWAGANAERPSAADKRQDGRPRFFVDSAKIGHDFTQPLRKGVSELRTDLESGTHQNPRSVHTPVTEEFNEDRAMERDMEMQNLGKP